MGRIAQQQGARLWREGFSTAGTFVRKDCSHDEADGFPFASPPGAVSITIPSLSCYVWSSVLPCVSVASAAVHHAFRVQSPGA